MGSRMLKRWLAFPLKDRQPIEERLSVVEQLMKDMSLFGLLQTHIKEIGDLERLISKVATGRINPREVVQLKRALKSIDPIQKACQSSGNNALETISKQLNPCILIRDRIANELEEEPPVALHKGGVIAVGVNAELDELRKIALSSQEHLQKILKRETELTGIPSLKIAFNNVFGYYLEVRNTHKDKVPEEWIRKQTLVNAERYITEELKELESKILGAEEKITALESGLFNDLVLALMEYIQPIQLNAQLIAKLDCLFSFATVSQTPMLCETKYSRGI